MNTSAFEPELRIAVGRWGPPALADENSQMLLDAGANHVASLLIESPNCLGGLLEMPRLPVPDTADAPGLTALGVTASELVAELATLDSEPIAVDSDEIAELDRRWKKIEAGHRIVMLRVFHGREAR